MCAFGMTDIVLQERHCEVHDSGLAQGSANFLYIKQIAKILGFLNHRMSIKSTQICCWNTKPFYIMFKLIGMFFKRTIIHKNRLRAKFDP